MNLLIYKIVLYRENIFKLVHEGGEDMDTVLFEHLYAACFHAIQRFCYYKLPSKSDGDDILQEVAIAAWTCRDSVRNADAFKPWLTRIAANKIRDFYRRRAKQLNIEFEEITELSLSDSRYGSNFSAS